MNNPVVHLDVWGAGRKAVMLKPLGLELDFIHEQSTLVGDKSLVPCKGIAWCQQPMHLNVALCKERYSGLVTASQLR